MSIPQNGRQDAPQMFAFSRFNGKNDNVPQAVELDWPGVCALLSKRRFTRSDSDAAKDGPLLSGANYPERVWRREGETASKVFDASNNTPEAWRAPLRCNQFAAFVSLAILDFDGGATLEQINVGVSRLNNGNGAAGYIYSTHSHTPDVPKYRLVLPMLEPVASADWPDVWKRLALAFDGAPDRSAKDAARMHYFPSCPKSREQFAVALELDGQPLDVSTLPEVPVERAEMPLLASCGESADRYADKTFENEIGRVCLAPKGQRNTILNKSALEIGHLIGAGRLDRPGAEEALLRAAIGAGLPEEEARKTIKSGLACGERDPNFKGMPDERGAVSSLGAKALPQLSQLPQSNAQPEKNEVFETFTFADMMNEPRGEWQIRGILKERTISVLSADSGGFKSFFALEMALCIATGTPFFGREVKRGTVVYVAAEGYEELLDRARAWSQERGVPLPSNFHVIKAPVNLADARAKAKIVTTIQKLEPAFLVLDTLSQNALGIEENSNTAMALFMAGMAEVGAMLGAHVQAVHHNSKAGGFRGAGSIKGNIDTHITLERPEGDQTNTVFVRCEKQRSKKFEPFALRGEEVEVEGVFDEYGDAITSLVFAPCSKIVTAKAHPNAQKADATKTRLLTIFDELAAKWDGVRAGTWCARAGVSETTFFRRLKELAPENGSGPIVKEGEFYRRTEVTPTTSTTPKTQNGSYGSGGTTPRSNLLPQLPHTLGVGVVEVDSGSAGSGSKSKRKSARATTASEPYGAANPTATGNDGDTDAAAGVDEF